MSPPHREYYHSNPIIPYCPFDDNFDGLPVNLPLRESSIDRAIDAALRSVALPDGLLSRLDQLARAMTDDTTNPVDWLGC